VQLAAVFNKTNSTAMRNLKRLRLYCSSFVFRLILAASFFAPGALQAQVQGNYTIDSRLPTANRNFQSFNDAIIFMSNGVSGNVTFDVAPGSGPYNEQIFMNYRIRATATKQVVFNCNGETLTFLSTNGLARAGIKMDSVDYVTIDNLKIVPQGVGAGQYGVGIHLLHDADHNIIRNCTIINQSNSAEPQNNEGIVINGSDDFSSSQGNANCDSNLIIKNTISGGNCGITMSSVPINPYPYSLMKGNQIIDNTISDAYNSAIYLLYNDNTLVQGNDITGGPHAEKGTGITCFEINTNMRLIGNKIHHFYADPSYTGDALIGINFGGALGVSTSPNLVANNLIYDFQNANDQYGIVAQYNGAYLNIYHNTISFEDHVVAGTGSTRAIYTDQYASVNILNNIISISRTTSGRNYGIYMAQNIARFNSNRNLFYLPSGSSTGNAVGYSGGTQTTLANWQTKTGKDLLSVTSDPQFTDAANFVLIPNDKAIDNMGEYAGVNNDITGAVRNNTHPDLGAYEFLTPTCIGPVAGGDATMLPNTTICEGSPMAMNLTNNSFGTNQAYQWQTSTTINGTYTNVGTPLAHPATTMPAVSTLYYRAAVTCGTLVEYSTPVLITVTPSLPASTYTINSAQATGGTNFQTFTDALYAIRCGIRGPVVFNVVDNGTPYREQLIIPRINGTSATNTVTFKGNGATVALATGVSAERAVIKLNGTQYFIFDGLRVTPEAATSGQYGVGFQFLNNAHHNTIKNCTIAMSITATISDLVGICMSPVANSYTSTASPSYCDSNTITGNTIIGGNYGLTCTSSATEFHKGNVFTNNIIRDFRTYGMYINNSLNALVEGNDISRPNRTSGFNGLYGIYTDGVHRSLKISKNKIHNPYGGARTNTGSAYAIFNSSNDATAYGETIIVSNNLIYNMDGHGPHNGIANSGANNVQYYHNTISMEDSAGTATQTCRAFYSGSAATGLLLKNNSIVIKRGGTGTKHLIYINDAATTIEINYNNLLNAAKAGTNNNIGRINGTDYKTMDLWQQNSLGDANSISVYPNYVNPALVDFTPGALDMDNKGTPVNIITDINGATRKAAKPDIGAYEFTVCLPLGAGPNVKVNKETLEVVSFTWDAVANATGYLVSTDGINFAAPSSGSNGLSHTITSGIMPNSEISLTVHALGTQDGCSMAPSQRVTAKIPGIKYYVPNTFTPNNNGKSDYFTVRSNAISTMRMMIFNQWGEKIFETSSQLPGWDGTYKGKQQPIGVYVYVLNMTMLDGTTVNKKGTINLIR
jgi:trimeric autotransporter adhesin